MKRISVVAWLVFGITALSTLTAVRVFAQPTASDVTLTGLVTCARCLDLNQHKGFTPWSWATYKVSQGDNIVLVASEKTFNLHGDRQQLSKYIQDKVTVSGHLDAGTIEVTNISRLTKVK